MNGTSGTKRVLIWGKTYPELSTRYRETVCTGACDEAGRPVRIYPVPLRYLPGNVQYDLWDWVSAPLQRSTADGRPESHKLVDRERIERVGHVDTGKDRSWAARKEIIFKDPSWHYGCVRDLEAAERVNKTSLGFIKVGRVQRVWLERRSDEERDQHREKLATIGSQQDLFGYAQKDLEFFPFRVKTHWFCERMTGTAACPGHNMVILDWGLGELGRRDGEEKALERMQQLSDLDAYDLHFFMGNFKAHPKNFGILGMWYPMKKNLEQQDFFSA